jgi:hypothetical protein
MKIFLACLFTIILESIVIYLLCTKMERKTRMEILVWSILINLSTNIPLNMISNVFPPSTIYLWIVYLVLGEIIIFTLEAFDYYFIIKKTKPAVIISLLANLFSFIVGSLFINLIF